MPKLSSPAFESCSPADAAQGPSELGDETLITQNEPTTSYDLQSDSSQPDIPSTSALDLYGPMFAPADMLVSSPNSASNLISNEEFPGQASLSGASSQQQLSLALQSLSEQVPPEIGSGNISPRNAFTRASLTNEIPSPLSPLNYDMAQDPAKDGAFSLNTSSWDNNFATNNFMFPGNDERFPSLNYDDNNLFLSDTVMPLMSPDYSDFPGRPMTPLSMQDSNW